MRDAIERGPATVGMDRQTVQESSNPRRFTGIDEPARACKFALVPLVANQDLSKRLAVGAARSAIILFRIILKLRSELYGSNE
jgi:hypothetical protein